MENTIRYIKVSSENREHCETFRSLMLTYIAEMNEHSERPLPEKFRNKWIDSIISMLGPHDRHLELCYLGDLPVGFLYGKIDHVDHKGYIKPGYGYIMEFYVKPDYRKRGIGTMMYRRLEGLFRADGAYTMYLTADPVTGRPFWEAVGFTNTGVKSPENQLYIYEKEITNQ